MSLKMRTAKILYMGMACALITSMTGCASSKGAVSENTQVEVQESQQEESSKSDLERYLKAGVVNEGYWDAIKEVMARAEKGETITIGAIGTSITQGGNASYWENAYLYLVQKWWQEKFPNAQINVVNAGIGATDSQWGVHRVDEHLLQYKPDFIMVDFAVNDENSEKAKETYESLIRKVLGSRTNGDSEPGVMIVNMSRYDTGYNVEEIHNRIGKYYNLPIVSVKDSIYAYIQDGGIEEKALTEDSLHPNDLGHEYIAALIISMLEEIYADGFGEGSSNTSKEEIVPNPTSLYNTPYEDATYYDNTSITPIKLGGFTKDETPKDGLWDQFKQGWVMKGIGDEISFEVEGSIISLMYKCSPNISGSEVVAIVDGDESNPITLEPNFPGGWGDYMRVTDLLKEEESKKHTVTIRVMNAADDAEFYLGAILVAK